MSFIIEYENGKLVENKRTCERLTPAPSVSCKDTKTVIVGELYGIEYDSVAKLDWKTNPDCINSLSGNLSIVYADDEECVIVSDETGIDALYYYHKGAHFLVSDDLWDIVKCLKIEFSDINQSWVRKTLISQLATNETVINNLKIVLPMQLIKYTPDNNELIVKEYKKFHYGNDITTLEDAVESMDKCIDRFFSLMEEKFGKDCVYGMGLSGGFDSRVIPHYAKKHDMNLTTYNICVRKPNGIFEANSCRNARKLAVNYDIPFKLVDYKANTIERKLALKTKMHPIGTCRNIFKFEDAGLPSYDVLLSGGYGVLIGDYLPLNILELDKEGVIAAIENLFLGMNNSTITFKKRIIKAINYVFGSNLKDKEKNDIEALSDLLKYDFEEARKEIRSYVEQMYSTGEYNNIEIFYKYFVNMLCSRDRFGAFESQFGTRRSVTLYMPFLHKETKRWSSELLLDRQVLRELIIRKIPEVKDVGTDSYTTAPDKQNSFTSRFSAIFNRVVRGNGTAIDEHYFNSKEVQREISKCMSNNNEWFYKILDIKNNYSEIMNRNHMRIAICIWELKYLIDYIETGKYMEDK